MTTDAYFLEKAAECKANGARTVDKATRDQWLKVARDWLGLVRDKTILP
jgi:hypothetical protein